METYQGLVLYVGDADVLASLSLASLWLTTNCLRLHVLEQAFIGIVTLYAGALLHAVCCSIAIASLQLGIHHIMRQP